MSRRGYLDWLRGAAVLLMIEAHTMDAWTLPADRDGWPYRVAIIMGGFAAPAFLFLAGVALALGAASRERRGATLKQVAARARRRGWQIFGLAFLFRLQAFLISGGRFPQSLLKVDILNIMGLAMVMAGAAWALAPDRRARTVSLIGASAAFALMAPVVSGASWPGSLPDWLEMYVRSIPGRTSFSLFPWPAYLFVGVAIGSWLATADAAVESRINRRLGQFGLLLAAGGGLATLLPPFAGQPTSMAIAPSVVCVRLGLVMLAVPIARAWHGRRDPGEAGQADTAQAHPGALRNTLRGPRVARRSLDGLRRSLASWSPVREFGVASLFVYWVHVEMAYGRPSKALHRDLSFWEAAAATLALMVVLYGLVRLKPVAGSWLSALSSRQAQRLEPRA